MAEHQIILAGQSPAIKGLQWESSNALRIGRLNTLEIVLHDVSVGRQHAEVYCTFQGWLLRDLGSGQGTLLNGVPVEAPRKLQAGDILQCGRLEFKVVQLHVPAPPAPVQPKNQNIQTTAQFVRVEAQAQRSWHQALEDLIHDQRSLPQGNHFLTLLRAGYHLSRIDSLDELLQTILDDTVAVLDARRGAIVLRDQQSGELDLMAVNGPNHGQGHSSHFYSQTLVQMCLNKGESMLCQDTAKLADLNGLSVLKEEMTSIICALLRSPRRRLGVLYLARGARQEPFSQSDFFLADAIAASVSVGIESAQVLVRQRSLFLDGGVRLAQNIMACFDPGLEAHSRRVVAFARVLGKELGLGPDDLHHLEMGALLHDIGKIRMTTGEGKRSKEEWTEHPIRGAAILENLSHLAEALAMVRHHHERWDGGGFPDHLASERIPPLARIVAAANALDHALRDHSLPWTEALTTMEKESGRALAPECVQAIVKAQARLQDLVNPPN